MSTESFDLGERMKGYEGVADVALTRRMPLIIRLDGKAFHTWTARVGCKKPFDPWLHYSFCETATRMAHELQGCCLGYLQSDEASFVLQDWWGLKTEAWLGKRVQKIASVAASMFTAWFNLDADDRFDGAPAAFFDARCFVLPEAEVCNYLLWRQRDATRNSVAALAQAHFSHNRLHGLNGEQMQELLFQEKGINWSDLPTWQKRGVCVVKGDGGAWVVDEEPPVFSQDWEYVGRRLQPVEEAQGGGAA